MVYGRGLGLQAGPISKTLHGGGTLVLPILQDYRYLSLEPMQVCEYITNMSSAIHLIAGHWFKRSSLIGKH